MTLFKSISEEHLRRLSEGVRLEDGWTAPSEAFLLPGSKGKKVALRIHEGKNRQVIRMFTVLGYKVHYLHRVAYGNITVKGLPRGAWRLLTRAEVSQLKQTVGLS